MPLVEEFPTSVASALAALRNGSAEEPLHVAVKTDIGPDGRLGERWIVVDGEAVRVFSPNGDATAHLDIALPLSEIKSTATESLVGGGALVADLGGETRELARYTTTRAATMGGVARTIDALAQEKDVPEASEDMQERLCPTCGRPLPKDNDVCRFCINKSAVLARLLGYAAPYRWQAILLVALMFAGTAASLVPGKILQQLTDRSLAPTRPYGMNERLSTLAWLVAALVGTQVLGTVIQVVRGRVSAFLSGRIT
jgi:hypothetical protein